jgi:hypothetical protein
VPPASLPSVAGKLDYRVGLCLPGLPGQAVVDQEGADVGNADGDVAAFNLDLRGNGSRLRPTVCG